MSEFDANSNHERPIYSQACDHIAEEMEQYGRLDTYFACLQSEYSQANEWQSLQSVQQDIVAGRNHTSNESTRIFTDCFGRGALLGMRILSYGSEQHPGTMIAKSIEWAHTQARRAADVFDTESSSDQNNINGLILTMGERGAEMFDQDFIPIAEIVSLKLNLDTHGSIDYINFGAGFVAYAVKEYADCCDGIRTLARADEMDMLFSDNDEAARHFDSELQKMINDDETT